MSFFFGKISPRGERRGIFGRFGPVVGGLLTILTSPFLLILHGFPFLLHFVAVWWGKREFKYLLFGLPTIIIAMVAAWFLIAGKMDGGAPQRGLLYRRAAVKAMSREDWQTAKLYFQRAVEMGVNDAPTRFELARAAESAGDTPVKVAVMQSLAPDDHPVFAKAHLWQATRILRQPNLRREEVDRAVVHLKHTLALSPRDALAGGMLGEVYFKMGVYQQAIPLLKQTDSSRPVWRLMLAKACALIGDRAGAQSFGEQAIVLFEKQLTADPADVQTRLDLGEAKLLLEEFQESIQILEEGHNLKPDPKYSKALTQVLIHWSDAVLRESPEEKNAAFQLLARALEHDPNEFLLFDRIVALLKSDNADLENIEDFLLNNITQGRAVGISHLILGTAMYERNEVEQGGFHLERAFELLPQGPIIANNYAWHLSQSEPSDPIRALTIINEVIRQFPTHPEYHDTRGHIQLELGDWKQAINDLEISLAADPKRISTHEALATAYSSLGNEDLAERHFELIKRLQGEDLNK